MDSCSARMVWHIKCTCPAQWPQFQSVPQPKSSIKNTRKARREIIAARSPLALAGLYMFFPVYICGSVTSCRGYKKRRFKVT